MVYVFYAYIALFFIVSAVLFIAEFTMVEPDEREPTVETVSDIALAAALLAGMLFLAFHVEHVWVKHLWKAVTIAAATYAIISNLRGRREELKNPNSAEDHASIGFVDTGTLILLGPALAFNFFFAFSR